MFKTTPNGDLPSNNDIRRAVATYVERAYGARAPRGVAGLIPPRNCQPAAWLMQGSIERTPPDGDGGACRSFALRLGNRCYPHMKLRIARVRGEPGFVFRVDTHDAMLVVPPGSHDEPALVALKTANALLAEEITTAWEARGLPTERSYLRSCIAQLKNGRGRET